MPRRHLRVRAEHADKLAAALAGIRDELGVPGGFPEAVLEEARGAAKHARTPDLDLTDVPFVTIDPPESMDLDQAMHLTRDGEGFLVRYAIADVASFVRPGGAIDREAHERGVTYYGPDSSAPLHPVELSEGAASLLPGTDRPALVWEIRLDSSGEQRGDATVRRALVRSVEKLGYRQVQAALDGGSAGPMLELLPTVGRLRQQVERERGGVSLPLPDQEIVGSGDKLGLEYRSQLPVEGWNAQISLLTGIAAASIMRQSGAGIFRTLPEVEPRDLARLRRVARALHVDWPEDVPYAEFVRSLDAGRSAHAAFLNESTTLFRGAAYRAFDASARGDTVPDGAMHGAIAAEYAHVTAPLRRLVDKYGQEICAAASAGTEVPSWVRDGLDRIPEVMAEAGRRAGSYEGACVSAIEAALLTGREGELFDGVIVDADPDGGRGQVVIDHPAVRGRVDGTAMPLGEEVRVRLEEASIDARRISFTLQ